MYKTQWAHRTSHIYNHSMKFVKKTVIWDIVGFKRSKITGQNVSKIWALGP